jgi:hypothetical protein
MKQCESTFFGARCDKPHTHTGLHHAATHHGPMTHTTYWKDESQDHVEALEERGWGELMRHRI